jgi:urease accessory protein
VLAICGVRKFPHKNEQINKTDLAEAVGADLAVMDRDAKKMRGTGPVVFAQVKNDVGVSDIGKHITQAWKEMEKEQPADAKKPKVTDE